MIKIGKIKTGKIYTR